MKSLLFDKRPARVSLLSITTLVMVLSLIVTLAVSPIVSPNNKVLAAGAPVAIDMINYGGHSTAIDASIVSAHPEFLVDNSPAGPWKGTANIKTFTSAGIEYFEYLDGGYEGTQARSIPNDITSNLNYITAAANAGATGIFLDEVSSNPNAASLSYLQQIYTKAHSLGLKVVFNTGVDSWSDSLMSYCDYINTSEVWNNTALTASQSKWASRSWVLTENVTDATTAANLTEDAWSKGLLAEYACVSYNSLPTYLSSYISQISGSTPPAATLPTATTGSATALTSTGATINGNLTSLGSASSVAVSFDWGLTSSYGNSSTAQTITAPNTFTAALTGLTASTTYHYRAKAVTGSSTVYGNDVTFTTASNTPVIVTGNTTGTVASAPVASGGASEYNLYLKVTSTTVSGVTVGQQIWCAASTTDFPNLLTVGATLTGNLDNSLGWWVFKKASTSTTPPTATPPTATTGSATGLTSASATISGNLTGMGSATSVQVSFNWGTTSSYGNTTSSQTATAAGAFSAGISNLSPNTTYHFRIQAVGSSTVYGNDATFTTSAAPITLTPPTATTGSATALTSTGATINGSLTSLGSSSSVAASFDWGLTSSYGNSTTAQTMMAPNTFTVALTGLTANTTYHYRAKAVTSSSTVYGNDGTFTTASNTTATVTGNTTGTVASAPASSGGANEYNLYLKITSTTVAGVTLGQQVWCAASTTDFPNLLTVGATLTGNLSNSPGWWVLTK